MKKAVIIASGIALISAAVVVAGCFAGSAKKTEKNIKKEVVIEAGSEIRIEEFFANCPADARFVTDISEIDTSVPAIYKLMISCKDVPDKEVTLKIEDHTGPEGRAVPKTIYTTWKMPEAKECVDHLYDISGIAKIEYRGGTPKFTEGGKYEVPVEITDTYGNATVINVPFTVINDHTAPVIRGVHDFELDEEDPKPDLLEGITVKDDFDDKPVLKVNDAAVRYGKAGKYEIVYSAMDKAGNIRTVKANVNIGSSGSDSESDEEEDYGNSGEAYEIAQRVMSNLWRDNDVETARAIFNWVHSNVYYQSISFFQTYEAAAYRGFTKHNGDCYVSYACAKMLLDCAGIKNMMVERYPVYQNGHYWNLVYLNGSWYHCDATVFRDHPGAYFMCTDDEIGDYHHDFNGSLYPERAGGSSEYRHEPEVTVTPTPVPTVTPTVTPTATPTVMPTVTPAAEPTDMPSPAPSVEPDVTPVPEQSDVPAPAADGTGIPETLPSEESAVPSESHEASTETNVSDTDVSDAFGANDQMVQSNPAESTN